MDEETLLTAFSQFLLNRSHTEEFLQKNPEYIESETEINNIFEDLKSYLPAEKVNETPHKLLRDCSDLKDTIVSIGIECAYRQGFSEGIRMLIYSLMVK